MGRGKTSTESQDGLVVPTELPLLQLEGQVPEAMSLPVAHLGQRHDSADLTTMSVCAGVAAYGSCTHLIAAQVGAQVGQQNKS